MDVITLNSEKMTSVGMTHQYLKNKLKFPDYYGGNLDALWDVLATTSKPYHIKLINYDELKEQLGQYADELLRVFIDAAKENDNIIFEYCSKTWGRKKMRIKE